MKQTGFVWKWAITENLMVYLIIIFLIKWPFGVISYLIFRHTHISSYIMVPVSYGFVNHTWNGILWQDKLADRLIILGTTNLCVRVSGWVGCPKIVGTRSFSPWTLKDPYIYIYVYIYIINIYIYRYIYSNIPHIFPYIPHIFPSIPPFSIYIPMYSPLFRPTRPSSLQGTLHSCSFSEGISSTPEKETPPVGVLSRCRWDPWGFHGGLPVETVLQMTRYDKWKKPPVNSSQLQSL